MIECNQTKPTKAGLYLYNDKGTPKLLEVIEVGAAGFWVCGYGSTNHMHGGFSVPLKFEHNQLMPVEHETGNVLICSTAHVTLKDSKILDTLVRDPEYSDKKFTMYVLNYNYGWQLRIPCVDVTAIAKTFSKELTKVIKHAKKLGYHRLELDMDAGRLWDLPKNHKPL
jgi:hypothetical protein